MTPQEYLESELEDLKAPSINEKLDNLEESILKMLLSHKFRKYTAKPELKEQIKEAIHLNVSEGQPINITFLHGAYKLWRLEEAPEADWAELFACMYYTNWLKPICEVYEPGVWFDFFVDDLIIPKLNNVEPQEVNRYLESYQEVLNFLKPYQPSNFRMTITPVGSQFASKDTFEKSLQKNIKEVSAALPNGLPILSDKQSAMVELNAKPTPEQLSDPKWKEKIHLIHDGYLITKREAGYHFRKEKILAFSQPLPSGTAVAVGTTKDSIMKFWIGAGVLRKKEESYRQVIHSPSQLERLQFSSENVSLEGLEGKNFGKIRLEQ
jgi:hypothetical protein